MICRAEHYRAYLVCRVCGGVVLRARELDWCPQPQDLITVAPWTYPDGRDVHSGDLAVCPHCGAGVDMTRLLSQIECRKEEEPS